MTEKAYQRLRYFLLVVVLGVAFLLAAAEAAPDCRTLFFKEYPQHNKILLNHVISNHTVNNERQCRFDCYDHHDCISYNTGPSLKQPGMILCQLNDAIRHQNPLDYVDKLGFTYRGAENPCASSPCHNNGTCQAGFTNKNFRCICGANYTGGRCRKRIKIWRQADYSKKVCIGTKNDAFGTFNVPAKGEIEVIKLQHISGGVSWGGGSQYIGNFGDTADEKFEIHITFPNKTRLAPPANYEYRYDLPGQKYSGKWLIYPSFKPWLPVQRGQEFNVWYGDDLRNYKEYDNKGTLCVHVYLRYADY